MRCNFFRCSFFVLQKFRNISLYSKLKLTVLRRDVLIYLILNKWANDNQHAFGTLGFTCSLRTLGSFLHRFVIPKLCAKNFLSCWKQRFYLLLSLKYSNLRHLKSRPKPSFCEDEEGSRFFPTWSAVRLPCSCLGGFFKAFFLYHNRIYECNSRKNIILVLF